MSTYISCVPSHPDHVRKLGRAIHAFTCLEWAILWTIAKLSSNGEDIPKGSSASEIAAALTRSVATTSPSLPGSLKCKLTTIGQLYRAAVDLRSKLLLTCGSRAQGRDAVRTSNEVAEATLFFKQAATFAFELFHGDLQRLHP